MEKNEPTQSKYDAALAKYNTQLDDAEIAAPVSYTHLTLPTKA